MTQDGDDNRVFTASHYTAYQQQQAQARAIAQRQQNIRNAYAQATGI